tara:strand:- start:713 stop:2470 length:1758 start_codon:yes stop_codon:yes gene_type:complete
MLDSKNIMLDIAKAPTSGPTGPAVQGQENIKADPAAKSDPFSALMDEAAARLKAAKSGNAMPPSQPPKLQASETSPQALLQSRTLKGGTALIIGGAEPTDEGLIAFAQSQGMDPTALGLLAGNLRGKIGVGENTSLSRELNRELNREQGAANDSSAIITDPAAVNIELQSLGQSSAIKAPIQASALTDKTAAAIPVVTAEPKLALPADKFLSDQQRLQITQSLEPKNSSKALGSPLQMESLQRINSHKPIESPQLTKSPQQIDSPQLTKSPQQIDSSQLTKSPQQIDGTRKKTTAIAGEASAALKNPAPEITNTINTLSIKPNSIITDAKLPSQAIPPGAQSEQPDAGKLTFGPNMADAFIKQHRERQGLPPSKLEAISLAQSKVAAVTSPTVIVSAAPLAAGLAPAPLFIEGQAASSATAANLNSEPTADTAVEEHRQDALRRHDDFAQLSRQLTDALGKRLTAQIQRGSWHVEMELHPKTLGRVEVQLEMKNGELEARFIAANATTRDLINEGMPRLREAFQEHGTETAYKDLGAANQGASDGKSTASDKADEALTPGQSSDIESDGSPTGRGLVADGLDILV